MKKIGVVLSGCGVYDGSEVHETVLTLLAIDRAGAQALCFAPDDDQHHVIDHTKGQPAEEKRNMLVEAARIARGEIKPLSELKAAELDALILPGGFGAAKNLSSFAFDGADCSVRSDVATAIAEVHEAKKPVGALCIAPVILAHVLGSEGVEVTIGTDPDTAKACESMGATHVECAADVCHVDRERLVVTTPAYMNAGSIKEAAAGIEKAVAALIELT